MTTTDVYIKSIAEDDLQKFILEHLDMDEEDLLKACVEFLEGKQC